MQAALIGVDIGTQGTRTALYSNDGALLAKSVEKSNLIQPAPGVVEEDPEQQVGSVCRTIRQCIQQSGINPADIAAVAIDGQMAGIIGVGSDGLAVTPYDSWLDTRCAPQIEEMKDRAAVEVTAATGCAPSFNHGPKILWWKAERADAFKTISAFVQPGGYAAMRLCGLSGADAFIDTTYLHFSGFADNRAGAWHDSLCGEFGVPTEKLPRIVNPSDTVGQVTAELASQSGLAKGTPVVAGCGDTAASFFSCGATRAGVCVDVAGTASVFAATTTDFRADTDGLVLGCGRAVAPGLWHPYAYINGGGMNLEWIRDMIRSALPGPTTLELDDLNGFAEEVTAPGGLPYFVPHFAGRVMPPMPRLRGSWVGLNWSHGVGDLYRAILESVAFEYAIYRDVLLRLYPDYAAVELRVTGGGERSELWNRIKATVLDMPVVGIAGGGAPMGSAMLAGLGVGVFADAQDAVESWISLATTVEPETAKKSIYASRTERYRLLLGTLNGFFEAEEESLT